MQDPSVRMDGTFPSFTFSDSTNDPDHDFDFNVLSEYLFDDEKNPALGLGNQAHNTANSSSCKSEDVSDNEGL
jgi:hypothetical protein